LGLNKRNKCRFDALKINYMTNTLIKFSFGVAILAGLSGCYPKGPVYYSDSDLTATNYDSGYLFGEDLTYALADSVIHVTDNNPSVIDRKHDQTILNQIEFNMNSRGFQEVEDPFEADFIITSYIWSTTTAGAVYPSWGWYYPGYGSPYYPWGGYVYSYTVGTVLVDILNTSGIDVEEGFIPIVWSGAINGAVSDSNSDTDKRIQNGINQCFEQSPYLIVAE
jgi:predicted small lipoprotein YifL